jgi:hypothetical protein
MDLISRWMAENSRGVSLSEKTCASTLLVLGPAEQFALQAQGFFLQLEIARMRDGAL